MGKKKLKSNSGKKVFSFTCPTEFFNSEKYLKMVNMFVLGTVCQYWGGCHKAEGQDKTSLQKGLLRKKRLQGMVDELKKWAKWWDKT